MKKTVFLILVFIVSASFIFAQSQRMSLAEQYTSSTCGPCGQINPGFDALLNSNADKITSIKYHMSWPAPGNDPMYHHNTVDNNARRNYYSVNSVPHVQIDGTYWAGNPGSVGQGLINSASSQPSPFNMQFHHELSPGEDYIYVTMLIEATDDVNGDLVAQMVIIEKHIHFSSPPGTNGETDFYNVMKKMLPTASGTALPNFTTGDYMILEESWELANVYENDELAAVGFIQNDGNKDIHQAVNSSIDPIVPIYNNDAEVLSVGGFGGDNCTGILKPEVTLRNNGQDELTSATIKYHVNGEEIFTHDWTGSLGSLERDVIELPEFTFTLIDENQFVVYVEQPNGQTDEYPKNDTLLTIIDKALVTDNQVTLTMRLDDYPEETSWEIVNSNGDIVHSGGDYTEPGQFINENYSFDVEDCYTFFIYDSGGDGLQGQGFFNIHIGSDIILQGTAFGSMDYNQFEYASFVGVDENISNTTIALYPNPVIDNVNIMINSLVEGMINIEVLDLTGRIIDSKQLTVEKGSNNIEFDLSRYRNGLYLVKANVGGQEVFEKIVLQR